MKICSIRIKDYHQFQDTYIDFRNPSTNQPANKICFIGRNGTGKSTLLALINDFLRSAPNFSNIPFLSVRIENGNEEFVVFSSNIIRKTIFFKKEIDSIVDWFENLTSDTNPRIIQDKINSQYRIFVYSGEELNFVKNASSLSDNSSDLLIYSPSETTLNSYLQVNDVPNANLNAALQLFNTFPYYHIVSDETVGEFWKMLIFLLKKRENDRELFENKKENLNKTKAQLISEFEKDNPRILDRIAQIWNKVLDKAGLEFDVENASNPIQLNDNLKAYIKLKASNQRIQYNQLSTGIRNFIFRVGHIYALFFNREVDRGFLLIDEPENSLFPDFLFDLVETYQELVINEKGKNNTQLFLATHNPIIAAQFEPHERVVLEWTEEGTVEALRGVSPAGDDPNDVLTNDFKLSNLMGAEGQKMWNEYLSLREKLRHLKNEEEKIKVMQKINSIGNAYNF
jgi:ABC-type taurine transport system ATPase subunit